jgi:hypothetical protein
LAPRLRPLAARRVRHPTSPGTTPCHAAPPSPVYKETAINSRKHASNRRAVRLARHPATPGTRACHAAPPLPGKHIVWSRKPQLMIMITGVEVHEVPICHTPSASNSAGVQCEHNTRSSFKINEVKCSTMFWLHPAQPVQHPSIPCNAAPPLNVLAASQVQ